ncbi:MAG: aminotransferase class V-fold PLP-dependent enzyme [Vicinamibacterales bacterium]
MTRHDTDAALDDEARAFEAFLDAYPGYRATASLDGLRARDYERLDRERHTYLDYTGGCLYGASQVAAHAALLQSAVLGNPHSASPASMASTRLVERTRRDVLDWFGADDDYVAVFTVNATGALKLVGESFPFSADARFLLTADNHNSVNGIREFAVARGATVAYAPLTVPDLRIDQARLDALLEPAGAGRPGLFAFPAQSNFSGVRHPLDLVARAQSLGWRVLLDAAAFAPTSRLDLRQVRPDFVTVSFYKMFGYPTGVGCLLARRDALAALERPWFGGGTVNFATVQGRRHILSPGEAGFEDGTLDYLGIPAVGIGLAHLRAADPALVHERIRCLTGWLLDGLLSLRHQNGRPMVRIYGPTTTDARGGTVTLNCYDPDGHLLDYRRVEEMAADARISLRTGCFCNPGAGETAEGLTEEDMLAGLAGGLDMTLPRFLQLVTHRGGKSAGAIRVSLGLVSTFGDVHRFLAFAASLRDQTRLTIGEASFDIESCRVIRDGA